jgi:hypothetical protein
MASDPCVPMLDMSKSLASVLFLFYFVFNILFRVDCWESDKDQGGY